MKYKFWIILILSLNAEAHQTKKVVLLLDQVHRAQAYWQSKAHDHKLVFWKRRPSTWLTQTRKTDIAFHQKQLAQQRTELIHTLALLSENSNPLSCSAFSKLSTRTAQTLAFHGMPSHFKNHWISYAEIAALTAIITFSLYYIQNYKTDSFKNLYPLSKRENDLSSELFTTDIKHNEQLYEDTVTKVLTNAMTVAQTTPLMHQALQGKTIEKLTFTEKQRIFLKLTAELGNIVNTEIKHAGAFLQRENQKSTDATEGVAFFTPLEDSGYYPELYRKNIKKINLIGTTVNEFKELAQSLGEEAQKYAILMNRLTEKNTDLVGLTTQILTTHALELKLKEACISHMAQSTIRDAKKAIPLAIGLYIGYLGMSNIYQHTIGISLVIPLKKDLISLQLVLNKERYAKDYATLSQGFKGECFYWLQRLHRYKDKLPVPYRAMYRRYLDDLENPTLLPEQKMTIITCLFHELDPLFKKD